VKALRADAKAKAGQIREPSTAHDKLKRQFRNWRQPFEHPKQIPTTLRKVTKVRDRDWSNLVSTVVTNAASMLLPQHVLPCIARQHVLYGNKIDTAFVTTVETRLVQSRSRMPPLLNVVGICVVCS
jgi:hypothetical protein